MIDFEKFEELVALLQTERVTLFECEHMGERLCLHLKQGDIPEPEPTDATALPTGTNAFTPEMATSVLRSPGIGYLQLRHPFVEEAWPGEGVRVTKGQVVAFLQAGDVLAPVEADRDGTLGQPLTEGGQLVGYGTPIFAWR